MVDGGECGVQDQLSICCWPGRMCSCFFVVRSACIELWLCASWTCPTARICLTVLPCRASQMTQNYLTSYTFSIMYAEWLVPMAFNDRYCILPSNDMSQNSKVDLTSSGVVTLDTPRLWWKGPGGPGAAWRFPERSSSVGSGWQFP